MDRLKIMEAAARAAGQFMLGAQHLTDHTEKSNAKDLVTIADIKSQDMLRAHLSEHFPKAVILSEEDSEESRTALYGANFTGYVLDPIDGTFNFKRDMRESAISIGYVENGNSVAGVIYDPFKNELFAAEQGSGAFRNDQPIRVSNQGSLEGASIATGNSYDDNAMERNLRRQLGIYEQTGVMPWFNCPGSGVLNIVYVACGRFDAFHHNGLKPWDNAAGFLIAREAGALVLNLKGEDISFTSASVLVATPTIADLLVDIFQKLPTELLT